MPKQPRSHMARFIYYGKLGDVAYFEAKDAEIHTVASRYDRRVSTERMLLMSGANDWQVAADSKSIPVVGITKVTIVE